MMVGETGFVDSGSIRVILTLYPSVPVFSGNAHIITAGRKVPGAAIVATVNEGHSLSEHAQPLRSVHANRTSGTTR